MTLSLSSQNLRNIKRLDDDRGSVSHPFSFSGSIVLKRTRVHQGNTIKGQTHATTKIFLGERFEPRLISGIRSGREGACDLRIFGEGAMGFACPVFCHGKPCHGQQFRLVSCPPTQHRWPFASWQHLTTRSLCRPFDVLFLLHRHHLISSSYTIATFVSFSCSSFTNTLLLLDSYFASSAHS